MNKKKNNNYKKRRVTPKEGPKSMNKIVKLKSNS